MKNTKVEGPETRYCIWVQGCSIHCRGCQAPHTWAHNGGKEYDTEDIIKDIFSQDGIEGVTFLGGEPFEQAEALGEIAAAVRKAGLGVLCFSGNYLEVLKKDKKNQKLLSNIDLLIDSPFEPEKADYSRPWCGSSNQRYHFLTNRYDESVFEKYKNKVEINISESGKVFMNGMGDFEKIMHEVDLVSLAKRYKGTKRGSFMAYKLSSLLKARFPLIYVTTFEEDRVTKYIKQVVTDEKQVKYPREVFTWAQTTGLYNTSTEKAVGDTTCPCKMLEYIRKYDKDAVFILYDFHVNFGTKCKSPDYNVIRKIRDIIPDLKLGNARKTVFFVSPTLLIPESLQKEITIYDFPLPTLSEVKRKLQAMINQNPSVKVTLEKNDADKLCKAALGLTLQEAESAFALAMVNDGKIDIKDLPVVLEEKIQVIKKTGILEYIKSDYSINDIGGLDNLKSWLLKRNNSWSEQAKKYCIPAPKGVLVTGVPGCGKSLTAKAMSTIWQLPLLKLDFGKVFSGLVGSSEENMRRALATAEAVAPSILWIDEIEKGLSGLGSNGDSGVSSRIFGQFLTWMQEKESPVFVIATANNINGLPPELLRKGRFDEIFFVDLPTLDERKEIFKLHLKKRLKDKEIAAEVSAVPNLCEELAKMTEGFIGSEIEQVVVSALCDAFFENRPLKFEDLVKNIQTTVPLSMTQREQILALRAWANVRAVSATKNSSRKEYKEEIDTENVGASRGGRQLDF